IRAEQGGLIVAAPAQVIVTTAIAALFLAFVGLAPIPAALIGLSIAMSSSVVIVNITKSRRRTTDKTTEDALLGWSAIQDTTGVALAAVLLALLGSSRWPIEQAAVGLVAFLVLAIVVARLLPIVLRAVHSEHDLFLIVSVSSGLALAGLGSFAFGVPLALAAFVGGLAARRGDLRGADRGGRAEHRRQHGRRPAGRSIRDGPARRRRLRSRVAALRSRHTRHGRAELARP